MSSMQGVQETKRLIGIMEKNMETTIACWGYIGLWSNNSKRNWKLLRIVYWGYIGL